ncbi:hypothetical protein AAXE64_08405 [Priestia megaterium]
MNTIDNVLNEIESLKRVNKRFKVPSDTKLIKFAVIQGNDNEGYSFKVLQGEYMDKKKYGKMSGATGKTFYRVRVSEDNIERVDKEMILEILS